MDNQTRFYHANELARISAPSCEGCGECCRGMGDTIELDPYDAHQFAVGLHRPFAELIGNAVEMHAENGIILPHLAMNGDMCSFLGTDGRCTVHGFRPGICRLYPLARQYVHREPSGQTDTAHENAAKSEVLYFILPDSCPAPSRSKVRIDRWIGIPDMKRYEAFKLDWHLFLKQAEEKAAKADHEEQKAFSLFLLETFFLRPYDGDFYELVTRRIKRSRRALGLG